MSAYKSEFWDERYSAEEFIYGAEPNQFFKEEIDKIQTPGRLLLPGEGEGRNAIYAAGCGWQVDAVDQSLIAKLKAESFAAKSNVKINYSVADLNTFSLKNNYYDCAAIIFVHLNHDLRKKLHKRIIESIRKDGKIIVELFSKKQLGFHSGGPQDLSMLTSVEEINDDFKDMKILMIEERQIILNEGDKHSGEASVVRFVGEKIY
jgi:hypothetical protein